MSADLPWIHSARAVAGLGGKGRNLARLAQAALPVPRAFVVPAAVFQDILRGSAVGPLLDAFAAAMLRGDEHAAVSVGAEIGLASRGLPWPRLRREALAAAVAALGRGPTVPGWPDDHAPRFAVRSSAEEEDGSSSYAGQLDSVLNLRSLDQVRDAVLTVWASAFGERCVRYRFARRTHHGEAAALPVVAVVVQRLVLPRVSGVVFTESPVRRRAGDLWVECGPGLGEALAQGQILPDAFRLERRPEGLRVVERAVARKERAWSVGAAGTTGHVAVDVPADQRDRALLDTVLLRTLGDLALAAEALQGRAVDVEFACTAEGRFALLQSRPITVAARPHTSIREIRSRPPLWSQRFSGERWPAGATPLGWSFVQPVLHHFIEWTDARRRHLHDVPPTRLHDGRPYFAVGIFRHLAFAPEGGEPPQFLLEMFPEAEQQELRAAAPYLPDLPVVASIVSELVRERRWRRYHFDPRDNDRRWAELEPHLRAQADALVPSDPTVAAAERALLDAQVLVREYLSVHLMSLLFAHLHWEALGRVLRSWGGGAADRLREALLAEDDGASPQNPTLAANDALRLLGRTLRASPHHLKRLQAHGRGPDPQIDDDDGGRQIRAQWTAVTSRFGHRSSASWELFSPRFADDPSLVLGLALAADGGTDRHQSAANRTRAEAMVRARLRRTWGRRLVPWRDFAFEAVLRRARIYSALRERQRFAFEHLMARSRDMALAVGAALVREGRLDRADDVRWLQMGQWRDGGADLRAIVTEKQQRWDERKAHPHPDFLEGDVAIADPDPGGVRLRGLGISGGRATGPVRVLHDVRSADRVVAGDVLVTRALDPGWTPVLLRASAVVLELGSVLSHGAVVAREYGVPAVANIGGATHHLTDGEVVTVDGDRGWVLRHRAP